MALVIKKKTLDAYSSRERHTRKSRRYFFLLEDTGATIDLIAAEAAVPVSIGDGHPSDASRLCDGIFPEYKDKQRLDLVVVEVTYSTSKNDYATSPLSDPPIWSLDTEIDEEEYYEDAVGNKAKLTNGKPIMPLPRRKKVAYKLIIKRTSLSRIPLRSLQTTTILSIPIRLVIQMVSLPILKVVT